MILPSRHLGAIEQIDNLLGHVEGANDERDSVPILLGIRERWPLVKTMLASPTYADGIETALKICKALYEESDETRIPDYWAGIGMCIEAIRALAPKPSN